MNILVRFEDRYGAFSIAEKAFNIEITKDIDRYRDENNTIQIMRGVTSSNILSIDSSIADNKYDAIILVYDMDRTTDDLSIQYMSAQSFNTRAKVLNESVLKQGSKVYFVPTIFCAETILLHKMDPTSVDFSIVFGGTNTAKLHSNILQDILTNIHCDIDDKKYYHHSGRLNEKIGRKSNIIFRIKRTDLFMDDGYDIEYTFRVLQREGFSKYNYAFFNWITSGNIVNTNGLLTFEQALAQQKDFEANIKEALNTGNTGLSYNNKDYK